MKLILIGKKESGFSLLEVIITSLIAAVGVLALITLQLSELKNARQAMATSQASILFSDITERIRSNPTSISEYTLSYREDLDEINCTTNSCQPAEIAEYDLYTWQLLLAQSLPTGGGVISASGNSVLIKIHWDADNNGSNGFNCPPESADDLDCLQVSIAI